MKNETSEQLDEFIINWHACSQRAQTAGKRKRKRKRKELVFKMRQKKGKERKLLQDTITSRGEDGRHVSDKANTVETERERSMF